MSASLTVARPSAARSSRGKECDASSANKRLGGQQGHNQKKQNQTKCAHDTSPQQNKTQLQMKAAGGEVGGTGRVRA
jgi:hypothetical protein